jgi:hypothetical protein
MRRKTMKSNLGDAKMMRRAQAEKRLAKGMIQWIRVGKLIRRYGAHNLWPEETEPVNNEDGN